MTAAFTCVLRDLGSLGSLIWRLSANRFVRHNTAQPAQHSSTGPELMTPVPPTPPSLCPGFPLQRCNGHLPATQGALPPRQTNMSQFIEGNFSGGEVGTCHWSPAYWPSTRLALEAAATHAAPRAAAATFLDSRFFPPYFTTTILWVSFQCKSTKFKDALAFLALITLTC